MQLPTLRQLEYFVAVAEEGGFHRAARRCGVSQPGLSAQVRQLERELEVRLFERDRRRVLLTPAGGALLDRGRAVLAGARDLSEAARVLGRPLQGPLRLGVIPTVAPYLLPRVLPRVRKRFPDLLLRLREDRTPRLVEDLEAGRLDLLLLALEADLGSADTLSLFADRFVLVVPRAHALARGPAPAPADLRDDEVLLLEDGHCLQDQALEVCRRARAHAFGDFRASSLGTLLEMVQGGDGVTLLPELAVASEARPRPGLRVRRFRAPEPGRTIGLAWRPGSPRSEEFRTLAPLLRPARASRRGGGA